YIRLNSAWGKEGNVYVLANGERTVNSIDAAGNEKVVYTADENVGRVSLWPSKTLPHTLYIVTMTKGAAAENPELQPFGMFLIDTEARSSTPMLSKNLEMFIGLEIVGEMTSGDVVYCECNREGGEGVGGTLFAWRRATGKTERLREFSAGSLWMLEGTDTLVFGGINDVVANPLISYDLKTGKEKTVWRFPGKNEWGFISVNTYSKQALAISQSGTYVISLTNGKTTFEKRWSQSEPQNVDGVWYPLATREGEYFKGMGQMDREAGLLTLKEDGFHLQKLPRNEVIGYVDSGALLLGSR
ncbi:MAG TPA: hypothetical protein PKV72_05090, partial [Candidatus Peribacteria bacterium]|nr:hypothetical protein [Candidatus Peribacteria bacterium]